MKERNLLRWGDVKTVPQREAIRGQIREALTELVNHPEVSAILNPIPIATTGTSNHPRILFITDRGFLVEDSVWVVNTSTLLSGLFGGGVGGKWVTSAPESISVEGAMDMCENRVGPREIIKVTQSLNRPTS